VTTTRGGFFVRSSSPIHFSAAVGLRSFQADGGRKTKTPREQRNLCGARMRELPAMSGARDRYSWRGIRGGVRRGGIRLGLW
jgi:hypothetical protein